MTAIKRYDLQTKLETVAPALADNTIVPILTHFLFTGKRLLAYNDRIALSVPMESDFKGAVQGKILMDMISMSNYAKSVALTANNDKAKLRIGSKTEVQLGMMPAADYMFQMPAVPKKSEGVLTDNEIFAAFENCLMSVSGYATINDQLGITMMADGRHVKLYSTDRRMMSYARLPMPQLALTANTRVIIPSEFCRQMLALKKETKDKQLVVRKDHVMFVADDIVLYGSLLKSDDPINFDAVFKRLLPPKFPTGMAKMDNEGKQYRRLKTAFEMAARITDIKTAETKTSVVVEKNLVKLSSSSDRGDIKDEVQLVSHPAVKASVNSALIRDGYDKYESILLTDKCTILASGPHSVCLVANIDT